MLTGKRYTVAMPGAIGRTTISFRVTSHDTDSVRVTSEAGKASVYNRKLFELAVNSGSLKEIAP